MSKLSLPPRANTQKQPGEIELNISQATSLTTLGPDINTIHIFVFVAPLLSLEGLVIFMCVFVCAHVCVCLSLAILLLHTLSPLAPSPPDLTGSGESCIAIGSINLSTIVNMD